MVFSALATPYWGLSFYGLPGGAYRAEMILGAAKSRVWWNWLSFFYGGDEKRQRGRRIFP